jgi:hypothetical protein
LAQVKVRVRVRIRVRVRVRDRVRVRVRVRVGMSPYLFPTRPTFGTVGGSTLTLTLTAGGLTLTLTLTVGGGRFPGKLEICQANVLA